jgi:hypothetical protein
MGKFELGPANESQRNLSRAFQRSLCGRLPANQSNVKVAYFVTSYRTANLGSESRHVTFNHGVVGSSPTALTMLCLQDRDFFDHRPVQDLRWLAILAPWLAISVLAAFQ